MCLFQRSQRYYWPFGGIFAGLGTWLQTNGGGIEPSDITLEVESGDIILHCEQTDAPGLLALNKPCLVHLSAPDGWQTVQDQDGRMLLLKVEHFSADLRGRRGALESIDHGRCRFVRETTDLLLERDIPHGHTAEQDKHEHGGGGKQLHAPGWASYMLASRLLDRASIPLRYHRVWHIGLDSAEEALFQLRRGFYLRCG